MVPTFASPPTTPFTDQITCPLLVPLTEAEYCCVQPTRPSWSVMLEGLTVTAMLLLVDPNWAEARPILLGSAELVAITSMLGESNTTIADPPIAPEVIPVSGCDLMFVIPSETSTFQIVGTPPTVT